MIHQGRPGIDLAPLDFKSMRTDLMEKFNSGAGMTDVLSSAMYPKVYDEYRIFRQKYSDLSVLPTVHFLRPMNTDEELEVQIEQVSENDDDSRERPESQLSSHTQPAVPLALSFIPPCRGCT